VVYTQVSFDTCWARVVARYEAATATGGDDHTVSREEMEQTFLHDDRDALVQHVRERNIPIAVVDNEAEGQEHLSAQVDKLFEELF
jgi:hypothetical protein